MIPETGHRIARTNKNIIIPKNVNDSSTLRLSSLLLVKLSY